MQPSAQSSQSQQQEKLDAAYQTMLARAKTGMEQAGPGPLSVGIHHYIQVAKDKAVELEELSREEAEKISDYLRRDLEDAAGYLARTGKELGDWMRFDLQLVEDRFLDMFGMMVDHTRLELDRLARQAHDAEFWRTGEVAGPGALRCAACGKEMHFHKTGHIPPCPACKGTQFRRTGEEVAE
jgi:hypothetical protein